MLTLARFVDEDDFAYLFAEPPNAVAEQTASGDFPYSDGLNENSSPSSSRQTIVEQDWSRVENLFPVQVVDNDNRLATRAIPSKGRFGISTPDNASQLLTMNNALGPEATNSQAPPNRRRRRMKDRSAPFLISLTSNQSCPRAETQRQ